MTLYVLKRERKGQGRGGGDLIYSVWKIKYRTKVLASNSIWIRSE